MSFFPTAQILQQLDQCKSYPDFNNYLAFIFAQGDSLPIEVGLLDFWLLQQGCLYAIGACRSLSMFICAPSHLC